jgi:hypothetical protein
VAASQERNTLPGVVLALSANRLHLIPVDRILQWLGKQGGIAMAKVRVTTGSEGPRHDPYGWTEIHFTKTDGTEVMLRTGGLGYDRLFVNGEKVGESYDPDTAMVDKFQELTGLTPMEAEELPEKLEASRLKHMTPDQQRFYHDCQEMDRSLRSYA